MNYLKKNTYVGYYGFVIFLIEKIRFRIFPHIKKIYFGLFLLDFLLENHFLDDLLVK